MWRHAYRTLLCIPISPQEVPYFSTLLSILLALNYFVVLLHFIPTNSYNINPSFLKLLNYPFLKLENAILGVQIAFFCFTVLVEYPVV